MPDPIPGFVKITDVRREFNTSRKSVERRRDRARKAGDSGVYKMFRLRTRDGEVLTEPKLEQVKTLRSQGKVPEWFVSRVWLTKEFGKRSDESQRQGTRQPSAQSAELQSESLAAVKQVYEARIEDLKEQLVTAREREAKALEYADRDKQRFATATAKLSEAFITLKSLADQQAQQRAIVDATSVDDSAAGKRGESTADSQHPADHQSDKNNPSPRRRFWGRLKLSRKR